MLKQEDDGKVSKERSGTDFARKLTDLLDQTRCAACPGRLRRNKNEAEGRKTVQKKGKKEKKKKVLMVETSFQCEIVRVSWKISKWVHQKFKKKNPLFKLVLVSIFCGKEGVFPLSKV